MFLLEIMVFNFQYLSSFWNEIAADVFYETFTSSQHKAWKFTSPAVFHKDLRNFLRKYRARLGLGFTYNRQLWNSGASTVFKKGMFLERKSDFGKATSSGKELQYTVVYEAGPRRSLLERLTDFLCVWYCWNSPTCARRDGNLTAKAKITTPGGSLRGDTTKGEKMKKRVSKQIKRFY